VSRAARLVTELPACSDSDVATYLKHAQALLFPSFVEGYGLPLIEALLQGTPAIASDLPAFREIAGDVPEYVDVLDAMAWLSRIDAYAGEESPARQSQIARIRRFGAPTWSRHFQLVDQFMESLA
jgi:glycosyltransferase involved in cell wall biosynthesis